MLPILIVTLCHRLIPPCAITLVSLLWLIDFFARLLYHLLTLAEIVLIAIATYTKQSQNRGLGYSHFAARIALHGADVHERQFLPRRRHHANSIEHELAVH